MKTLHKHLIREVLASLVMTVVVFTFVLLIGNGLKEILPLLIAGNAHLDTIFEAIVLLIPFVLVFALPMGLLTATLLVFGRFSADQELTAARASGISLFSLISPVLLLSLLCCVISAWINMSLGPQCRVGYLDLLLKLRGELVSAQLPEGRYIRDFPGYIFFVGKNTGSQLQDIMIYKLENETNVPVSIYAPRGELLASTTNKSLALHLFEPRIVTFSGTRPPVVTSISETIIDLDRNNSPNRNAKPKISDMTFWQLRDELHNLEQSADAFPAAGSTDAAQAQLAALKRQRDDLLEPVRVTLHRELAFSFACFGFTLVGIPLGIRVHRRETNIGVAIALGLVLVYYGFVLVGQSLAARPEFHPHLILWVPNFIFQGVGAVLLWRANRGI